MIIDLAQEKGLKDSPLTQDTDNIDHKDSIDGILKVWDRNEDGFVDKDEVRYSIHDIFLSLEDTGWLWYQFTFHACLTNSMTQILTFFRTFPMLRKNYNLIFLLLYYNLTGSLSTW